jgi:hypothetical protein
MELLQMAVKRVFFLKAAELAKWAYPDYGR